MKIADRTPFRNENGQVDLYGRIQGTIKFGLSWFARIEAQETVIAVLDKVLGSEYILLRNITLPDTEIELPMVLIGPPGVFLINVIHERGVYRARDDEWGTISGDKFVPASINQVQRTVKLSRVLQIYLDRAGYKDDLIVDPILLAADPGMHIDSVRPAARIVLSDALERFAISMNQARPIFLTGKIVEIAQTIINGPRKSSNPASSAAAPFSKVQRDINAAVPESQSQEPHPAFTPETLGFSFEEKAQTQQDLPSQNAQTLISLDSKPETAPTLAIPNHSPNNQTYIDESELESDRLAFYQMNTETLVQPPTDIEPQPVLFEGDEPKSNENGADTGNKLDTPPVKKNSLFGMTKGQVLVLGSILIFWLCAMVGFAIYVYLNL